jgi:hypothetical protein
MVARSRVVLACLLALGLIVLAGAFPLAAIAAPQPKVVLVVGPVGTTTDRYRRLADEAAAEARRFTPNVVRVYSPNATWPAVKRALQGAAIVVYLGHGNGWPSPHRATSFPATQNGFGLNPVGGGDDSSHQYFGETTIASEVRLAPNAVVLLHHLCYASGNSEPGVPEGGVELAQQRVDNFAAGFLRAGAGAVLAEAHSGPAWYVRELLTSRRSIDTIWRSAPTSNNHLIRYASTRTPGHVAQLDPERPSSGFYRSLVTRPGLAAGQVRTAVAGPIGLGPLPELPHTLVDLGLAVRAPALVDVPVAGSRTVLAVSYQTVAGMALPKGLEVAVRWDPLEVDEIPTIPAGSAGSPTPGTHGSPGTTPSPTSPSAPVPGPVVAPTGGPRLVVAESPGSVVAPIAARVGRSALALEVDVPATPGLYRLVTTFHDEAGLAYDSATQALVPTLLIRVTGRLDAHFSVSPVDAAAPGETVRVPVTVTNLGAESWGRAGVNRPRMQRDDVAAEPAVLVARWIGLDAASRLVDTPAPVEIKLADSLASGRSASVVVQLVAPDAPGEYLVMLDVVLPGDRSVTAAGVPPGLVRVTVD